MLKNESEAYRENIKTCRNAPLGFRRDRERCGGDALNVAPIARIEEDVRAIKKDCRRKMSDITLRYLLSKRLIKNHLYSGYRASNPCPESRILTEHNIISDVNNRLVELYEGV